MTSSAKIDIDWTRVSAETDFMLTDKSPDAAKVMVSLRGSGCVDYSLEKVDGAWKISGVSFPGYKGVNEFTEMMEQMGVIM